MARKSRKQALLVQQAEKGPQEKVFRAGLYLRLSVESHEDMESNSLGHQREICLDYLKDKPEIQVWETYMDNGFSGTNFDRTDFQRMVSDIRNGSINCVVVKDLSRFGRNYLDVDEYLNVKFPAWGVRFISVLEGFDTAVPNRENQFIVPFRNILNDYYARDISQKRKSAIRAKMEAGEYLPAGNNVPFGYLPDKENCTFRIDPQTAPIVVRIFRMRSQGMSMKSIAEKLNQEEIPSPIQYRFQKGILTDVRYANRIWTDGQVEGILKNEAYLGIRIHRKTECTIGKIRYTAPEEQIRFHGAHEPIVTKELFQKVQPEKRSSVRQKPKDTPPCKADYREGLKGRIFCGNCGSKITVNTKCISLGRSIYYTRCANYLHNHFDCTSHSISLEKLGILLQTELNRQVDLMDGAIQCMKREGISQECDKNVLMRQLQSVKVRRSHLRGHQHQLLSDYMDGKLDREELQRLREKAASLYDALTAQEAEIQSRLGAYQRLEAEAKQWTACIRDYRKERTMTNKLMMETIERIELYQQGKQITVHVTFRYQDVYRAVAGGGSHEA